MRQVRHLASVELAKGQTRLGRPSQRHLRLLHRNLPTLPPQHQPLGRLQRHRFPQRRNPLLIHRIMRMHLTQTTAMRNPPGPAVELAKVRSSPLSLL